MFVCRCVRVVARRGQCADAMRAPLRQRCARAPSPPPPPRACCCSPSCLPVSATSVRGPSPRPHRIATAPLTPLTDRRLCCSGMRRQPGRQEALRRSAQQLQQTGAARAQRQRRSHSAHQAQAQPAHRRGQFKYLTNSEVLKRQTKCRKIQLGYHILHNLNKKWYSLLINIFSRIVILII